MRGIEPLTFSLPRKRSTPELHRLYSQWFMTKSGCNTQKYKHPIFFLKNVSERKTGFEPAALSLEG